MNNTLPQKPIPQQWDNTAAKWALSALHIPFVQLLIGCAFWCGFAAFMCLTDAGLAMAGDMTLLVLVAWNIFADVLHLPRAPYFPS